MATLFAWARSVGGFPVEHVWLTTYSDPFEGRVPPPDYWYCFGGVHSPRDAQSRLVAKVIDANLDAARLICEPNNPTATGGMRYGVDGVDHQLANRILRAAAKRREKATTVAGAKGYLHSTLIFSAYGRDDSWRLYASEEPPKQVIEVVQTISPELMKYLAKHPEGIHEITSRQFEELIAEILAGYGWDVELTPATKDGGYDLYAISKDISGLRSHWIIECKKWAPDRKVGVEIVRALYGVKSDRKMGNALLATTSHFTHGVEAFKNSRYDLALKDYEGILQWINEYTPHPNGKLYIRDNRLVIPQSGRSS